MPPSDRTFDPLGKLHSPTGGKAEGVLLPGPGPREYTVESAPETEEVRRLVRRPP